jgi:hypothetical protein
MSNPFPGMNPFLEDEALWPDFHRRLVQTIKQVLIPGLSDRYVVNFAQRVYCIGSVSSTSTGECHEDALEVRENTGRRLVTLLDVVTPANRTTPEGRQAYLDQRRAAIPANLVEIDLVLQGQPMLDYSREGLPEWDYAVTVTRSTHPARYEIYTATLQKRLPKFRLPLAADDRDTVLDLQATFTRCYEEGNFAARIDFHADPPGLLSKENRRWLDETLLAKGLRAPHGEIALLAFAHWEKEGRPHGRDKEHWSMALKQWKREKHARPK